MSCFLLNNLHANYYDEYWSIRRQEFVLYFSKQSKDYNSDMRKNEMHKCTSMTSLLSITEHNIIYTR